MNFSWPITATLIGYICNEVVFLIRKGFDMYTEAKKLHLIEELLKVESDTILAELETVLTHFKEIDNIALV